MNPNEYQKLAARTLMDNNLQATKIISQLNVHPRMGHIIMAALKLNSESGELSDTLVKNLCYGQQLDAFNLIEECGDLLWYIASILTNLDVSMEQCMRENINKLNIRYPEKYTDQLAFDRRDKQV